MAQLALKALDIPISPEPQPTQQKKRRFFGKNGD
jgi:hypothetical protein